MQGKRGRRQRPGHSDAMVHNGAVAVMTLLGLRTKPVAAANIADRLCQRRHVHVPLAALFVGKPTLLCLSRLCRGEASLPRAVEAHLMGAGWPFTARGGSLLVSVPARRA